MPWRKRVRLIHRDDSAEIISRREQIGIKQTDNKNQRTNQFRYIFREC